MYVTVVFQFDPGLGGLIEHPQIQVRDTFEHGQQPRFGGHPEHLLFGVLVGRIRQGQFVEDPQIEQALLDFPRRERPAVVAHQRPR